MRTTETPRGSRKATGVIVMEPINDDFKKITISYGFMETAERAQGAGACCASKQGLKFDIMSTSFFLGRRSVDRLGVAAACPCGRTSCSSILMRNAANPTDFFKIPPGRVVELGAQVTV